jgi:hypothetical protein
MKNLIRFTIALLSLAAMHSQAQYTTPGNNLNLTLDYLVANSGGVVSFSNGTYFINNTLTISATDTLHINSAATIRTAATIRIEVAGTIKSNPASGKVLFSAMDTTSTAQNFRGFRFDNSNGNVFRNTVITHGGGLQLISSEALFEYCKFRRNGSSNVSAAITYSSCSPVIRYCSFIENERSAIGSGANVLGSPHIMYSTFIHNTMDNTNRPQINLGPGAAETLFIVGNYIEGINDNAGGIGISNLVGAGSTIAVVSYNTIVNNRYGYAQIGNNINSQITDNIILNNNIQNQPNIGGSGLNFQAAGSGNTATVRRNIISGNLWGVTIIDQAQPNFGTSFDPGMNILYENGNSGQTYALYNNTALTINAIGNYWGTNNAAQAEAFIFHQPDDPSLGLVLYQPIIQLFPIINNFRFRAADNPGLSEDVIGTVNQANHTVELLVPPGTDVSTLVPTIEIPYGAAINPASGTAQNFIQPVIYTVQVPHGEQQAWTVNVYIDQPVYNVTFIVSDKDSGLPLEDVSITMEDIGMQLTDAGGMAIFSGIEPGLYLWTATKTGWYDEGGEVEVSNQDVQVLIEMELITSLQEFEQPKLSLYPNPTMDFLVVKYPQQAMVTVVDLHGRILVKATTLNGTLELNVADWPKGTYIVVCKSATNTVVGSVVKE